MGSNSHIFFMLLMAAPSHLVMYEQLWHHHRQIVTLTVSSQASSLSSSLLHDSPFSSSTVSSSPFSAIFFPLGPLLFLLELSFVHKSASFISQANAREMVCFNGSPVSAAPPAKVTLIHLQLQDQLYFWTMWFHKSLFPRWSPPTFPTKMALGQMQRLTSIWKMPAGLRQVWRTLLGPCLKLEWNTAICRGRCFTSADILNRMRAADQTSRKKTAQNVWNWCSKDAKKKKKILRKMR